MIRCSRETRIFDAMGADGEPDVVRGWCFGVSLYSVWLELWCEGKRGVSPEINGSKKVAIMDMWNESLIRTFYRILVKFKI